MGDHTLPGLRLSKPFACTLVPFCARGWKLHDLRTNHLSKTLQSDTTNGSRTREGVTTMAVIKPKVKEPEPIDIWNVKLPFNAIWGIYARQSTPAQLVKNTQS